MNLIEQILAQASRQEEVKPGQILEAEIDAAMVHDLTAPLTIKSFNEIGVSKVWDPDRIIVIFDHLVPANTVRTAELQKAVRRFIVEQGIRKFYDAGRGGVCHQVMVEKGHVRPGQVIVGADSHTCTYGALGAFATGIGSTDMASVFATGRLWFKVPETIGVRVEGDFRKYVGPKDLILHVIGRLGSGGASYKAMEFYGSTISDMSIDGRMTICNMIVEAGGKSGIVEADKKTVEYLKGRSEQPLKNLRRDAAPAYHSKLDVDVGSLDPVVACPPQVDNVKPVRQLQDIRLDQVFIGSCTNGRIEDLRIAAEILKDKKVHKDVRAIIIPASNEVLSQSIREGLVDMLLESGAVLGNPNCGPCLGGHMGILAADEVCLSTSNRNFIGRMGSTKAEVYLASPATTAASAVAGRIVDPRDFIGVGS